MTNQSKATVYEKALDTYDALTVEQFIREWRMTLPDDDSIVELIDNPEDTELREILTIDLATHWLKGVIDDENDHKLQVSLGK